MALATTDPEYVRLVTQIADVWDGAREQAFNAVNTSLLMANWKTGEYIVEFEQNGEVRAKYGDALLVNLSKDLTRLRGRGFSRSVLTYMRKFYLAFPKCATVSHKLTWSHYLELLKCDEPLEMQFYLYALAGIDNNLFAARYQLYLPNKDELQEQLNHMLKN